jgi:hypothetical protein
MTVTSTTNRNQYVGNGATTIFAYTFRIFAATDLLVTDTDTLGLETTLAINVDYTVDGVLAADGGNVTLLTALAGDGTDANSHKLTIRRVVTATQPTDLRNQGKITAEILERAMDRAVMLIQQLDDARARSLRLPESEAGSDALTILPPLAERKGMAFGFDETTGAPGAYGPLGGATVSAAMTPVVQAATLANGRTAMGPWDDVALTDVATGDASTAKHGWLKKLSNNAKQFMNGVGAWVSAALPYFTDARHEASPNDSAPVHALSAINGGADAATHVAIVPSAAGGIMAAIPDGTATGGNPRGQRSVDLQLSRAAAAQVASGANSAIIAGANNTASGARSATVGGESNLAYGVNAVAMGSGCTAVHDNSLVHGVGGYSTQANSRKHAISDSKGGDELAIGASTTDATPTVINASGWGYTIPVQPDETLRIVADIVGFRVSGGTEAAGYTIEATVKRPTDEASTALVSSVVVRAQEDAAGWDATIVVDTTNGAANIRLTGGAYNVEWFAWVRVTRVRRV